MLYLTGSISADLDRYRQIDGDDGNLGLMVQPGTACYLDRACIYGWVGVDNGCFSAIGRARFDLPAYLHLIEEAVTRVGDHVLFATARDVWADWEETLRLSLPMLPTIRRLAPAALVFQDGATPANVPWDAFDVGFLGGSDAWRDSPACLRLIREARRRLHWLHLGRVNSLRAMRWAKRLGFDSVDGTKLKYMAGEVFGGITEVSSWLEEVNGPTWLRYARGEDCLADVRLGIISDECEDEGVPTMATTKAIKVPAIRYTQGKSNVLYSFVLDGKKINEFAKVSRMTHTGDGIKGYQRPEIDAHVAEITKYLNGENPMMPNSVVLAFTDPVRFQPLEKDAEGPQIGTLTIPLKGEFDALIVDAQQRLAAIGSSTIESFNMAVVGFVAETEEEQREQFIRVNNSKPLPKAMLYQLVPHIAGEITAALTKKKLPSMLLERLNDDPDSPFKGLIKYATNPDGLVKDGTMLRMIEASLGEGYLYHLRADENFEGMVNVLKNYWEAVRLVFAKAWSLPAKDSRLLQAAGIMSLGSLMDTIADDAEPTALTVAYFKKELKKVAPVCRWTEGIWDLGPDGTRPWDGIENTTRGIKSISVILSSTYRRTLKTDGKLAVVGNGTVNA